MEPIKEEQSQSLQEAQGAQGPRDPEQEHPAHEAHGGSMAPDLVDDTGHKKPQEPENQP
jgi:hypothetical protein